MTTLDAFVLSEGLVLSPATRWRAWMDETEDRFADRCLPMLIANQAGWFLALDATVELTWDGSENRTGIRVLCDSHLAPKSHFGNGIATWPVPCVFRTDVGWNLLIRGPSNMCKDGIAPLEGVVETDWTAATFTMNWRFTRPCSVRWQAGEPFAMIVPQRRHELEEFRPRRLSAANDPQLLKDHENWAGSRRAFLEDLQNAGSAARTAGWQRDYFVGPTISGDPGVTHQTVLRLRSFEAVDVQGQAPGSADR